MGEEDDQSLNFSWTSDDELETGERPVDSTLSVVNNFEDQKCDVGEACSSSGPSSALFRQFVAMGFSRELILKAMEENREGNENSILEAILSYQEMTSNGYHAGGISSEKEKVVDSNQQQASDSDIWSSDYEENSMNDYSDSDVCIKTEAGLESLHEMSEKLLVEDMRFPKEEVLLAIERCGPNATIGDLADFIMAAQLAREDKCYYEEPLARENIEHKKRRLVDTLVDRKRLKGLNDENEPIRLPKPMVGFGVPTEACFFVDSRQLPEAAVGPPYFFYENVALAPKGVWDTISRFLYDVEPEFMDSKFFCAAARKRGYIHNLPISHRFPIIPLPHRTICKALPMTEKWWPKWDKRTTLNCLQTAIGSAKLTERIRKALEDCNEDPPPHVQKYVIEQCKKWNLVWVGRNKVAPLEPDEMEMLLGFPKYHTRGGGISRTDRYKSLGNSFQVDTVGYLLSPLKELFPKGMNVLSLFTGIGGGEVALHKLGITLKNVVSVEISEVNRNILTSWWEQTNQKGKLKHFVDVRELTADLLQKMMSSIGGFDMVIGGSPCNNLAGSNRVSRDGLEGKESSLFFEYVRILDVVRSASRNQL